MKKRPTITLHLCCLSPNFFLSWTCLLQSPYVSWAFPGPLLCFPENREGWINLQEVLSQLTWDAFCFQFSLLWLPSLDEGLVGLAGLWVAASMLSWATFGTKYTPATKI